MRRVRFAIVWFCLLVLVGFGEAAQTICRGESPSDADAIIQKAVSRARRSETPPDFSYTKVTITEELDNTGNVKERTERVYQASLHSGLSYLRLVRIDGHAPNAEEQRKQADNEKLMHAIVGRSGSEKGDDRETFLTPELVARFNFTLVGHTTINGRPASQIRFVPKNPQLPERHVVDRLLNRISGTLWIDDREFEIARAEVDLRSEFYVLGGVIGSLKKLAYTLVRTRVADGVWFNTLSTGDFEGRKLLDLTHIKTRSVSKDFRRADPAGRGEGVRS